MAKKIKSVNEFLDQIKDNRKSSSGEVLPNKFNKKKFNAFVNTLANDTSYTLETVAKVVDGNIETEDINLSETIRAWVKSILEKVGVDKNESLIVMSPDFELPVGDLYEFVAAALYLYMKGGNKFDFLKTPKFTATLQIKDTPSTEVEREAFHPQTRESLGIFKTKTAAHETLVVKNTTPDWLKKRKLVKQKK